MIKRTWLINPVVDGPCYQGRNARAGERICGWLGLVEDLEVLAGIVSVPVSRSERVGKLLSRMPSMKGFWSESAAQDRVGVADNLLQLRDRLMMAGWSGKDGSGRLHQLSELFRDIPDGSPDRLLALIHNVTPALARHLRVIIPADKADLQGLHLQLINTLQQAGSDCRFIPPEQRKPPKVMLFQPPTAFEAAEHLACWLIKYRHQYRDVVVINPDIQLDQTFRHHGLPGSGAAVDAEAGNSLLALFRLLPLLDEDVPDPYAVLEFLLLPKCPLPQSYRLANTLHELPAVAGEFWQKKIDEIMKDLGQSVHDGNVEKFEERMRQIFPGAKDPYRVERLRNLLGELLQPWLGGLIGHCVDEYEKKHLGQALAVISDLKILLERHDNTDVLDAPTWIRYVALSMPRKAFGQPGDAGIHYVQHPSQIISPADLVIWWGFTVDQAEVLRPFPLRQDERVVLMGTGVDIQANEEAEARQMEWGWRIPFLQTNNRIILVSPGQNPAGDANCVHPAWDEHAAMWSDDQKHAVIVTGPLDERLLKRNIPVRPLGARREWSLFKGVPPRQVESPSGMQKLLECPFKWTMNYAAGLRESGARPLASGGLLEGKVFHALFHSLVEQKVTEATLVEEGLKLFDEQIGTMAAAWARPGGEAHRARFRLRFKRNLEQLKGCMGRIVSSEKEYKGNIVDHHHFEGRIDLVLKNPGKVIDFKNTGNGPGKLLKGDAAVQLIAYVELLRQNDIIDARAVYFVLKESKELEGGQGTDSEDAWHDLKQTYLQALGKLQEVVTAAGVRGDEVVVKKAAKIDGQIVLEPECDYCSYDLLCGKHLEVNA